MVASRSRWPVTASSTGRGGRAEPALLKCSTRVTPGVSARSRETSSIRRHQRAGRRPRGRVRAGELEAGRPAARKAEVADDRVLDALHDEGHARVVGAGLAPVVRSLEEALTREADRHQLLRWPSVAPPEPAVLPVQRVVVLAGLGLPG